MIDRQRLSPLGEARFPRCARPTVEHMFPRVRILEDVSFVHDGSAVTSAGGAKSFDAALYLVELLYGREAAEGVARGLVIDWDPGAIAWHRAP